jgi:hypothetical protein
MKSLSERRREEARPVEEAGGGEAEGFEQAEKDLIDRAQDPAGHRAAGRAFPPEAESDRSTADYGEADGQKPADS